MRGTHISFAQLTDLVEGRLAPNQATQTQAHVAGCGECSRTVSWLEQTIGLMRSDQSEDAPAAVIARAVRAFRPTPRPALGDTLRQIVAVLGFDSARNQPTFGTRSTGQAPRQLLFNAPPYDLDLRLVPSAAGWTLSGQLLGPITSGEVRLEGLISLTTELNALCEFSLGNIPMGQYTLRIKIGDTEIVIPDLELAA